MVRTALLFALSLPACGGEGSDVPAPHELAGTVGAAGGALTGDSGIFDGLEVRVPEGALAGDTRLTVTEATDTNPLPEGGVSLGPQFRLGPADTTFGEPLTVTVPYSVALLGDEGGDPLAVKVWYVGPEGWALLQPSARAEGTVTVDLDLATAFGAGMVHTDG